MPRVATETGYRRQVASWHSVDPEEKVREGLASRLHNRFPSITTIFPAFKNNDPISRLCALIDCILVMRLIDELC